MTPKNEFDEFASNYLNMLKNPLRNFVNSNNEYFVEAKTKLIKRIINAQFLSDRKINIVDVGAGIGIFEKFLQDRKINIFGLDLSYKMVRVASKVNTISQGGYCQANAIHLPLPNDFADIVFASCVIHHISDHIRANFIKDMYRICKPGGRMIIFEHNPYNLLTQFVVKTTPLDNNAILTTSKEIIGLFNLLKINNLIVCYFLYGSHKIDGFIYESLNFMKSIPFGGQFYIEAIKDL